MKNLLTYPSKTGWITPRAMEIQLTTNNMLLIMPKPIAELSKVWLNTTGIQVFVKYGDSTNNTKVNLYDLTTSPNDLSTRLQYIDISKYIVEKAVYDGLKVRGALETITTDVVKNNASYYVRNTQNIKICTEKTGFFSSIPIEEAVMLSLRTVFATTPLYYQGYTVTDTGAVAETSSSLLDWEYRVEFVPLGETIRLNTLKTHPEKVQYAIPFNQQQQIVSSVGLGRNMQSVTDRTGAETRQIVRRVRSVAELRKIGSYSGSWRLTDVALTATNSRLIVTETWSKDWSVRSQFVGVNREFRSWNIPSGITQRNLLWQDYLYISNFYKGGSDQLISDGAKDVLAKFITGQDYPTNSEITSMWLLNSAGTRGAVLSCSAFGFGNSLVFSAKTKDNLGAGTRRKQISSDDAHWTECVDVYYTDENGEFENNAIKVSMGANIANMQSDVYPETYTEGSVTYNALDTTATVLFADKTFTVNKDPSEQINFTYQLHVVTSNHDLIIGTAFAARNPLVTNNKAQLKYWELTKKLPQGAQTMSSYYGREISESVLTLGTLGRIQFAQRSGADVVGVCVTDENNNILLARNTNAPLLRTFYLNCTHDYNQITGG